MKSAQCHYSGVLNGWKQYSVGLATISILYIYGYKNGKAIGWKEKSIRLDVWR